ncbi:Uma2 family endonuclease [Tundrisphaera sp. TA3]|uniref:Uma2 family endonuclease n=1 Tax=Tundrisphaera sp. TA3 TaxID=3435775 RepID=UPI003EBF4F09
MSTATRITVEQYMAMADRGDFDPPHHRVELIRGEIVAKDTGSDAGPSNAPHNGTVIAMTMWCAKIVPDRVDLSVGRNVDIAELDSMPEPDITWLAARDYTLALPTAADILLAIEVSDSSLRRDRRVKAPLYAEAGIRDYWIVNVPGRCVEVFRDPVGGVYREMTTFKAGQDVPVLRFPEIVLPVGRIFPATTNEG